MSTFKTQQLLCAMAIYSRKKTSSDWKWSTTLVGRIYPSTIWRLHHSSQFIRIPLTLGHEFRWMQAPTPKNPKNLQLPRWRLEVTIVIAGWGSSINLHLNPLTMVPPGFLDRHCPHVSRFSRIGAILLEPPKIGPTWRSESAIELYPAETQKIELHLPGAFEMHFRAYLLGWWSGCAWWMIHVVRQAARKISHDFQLRLLRFDWIDEPFNHPILKTYKKH